MLDSLIEHNRRHSIPLSSKKLREVVIRAMEDEEKYVEPNVNKVTTDTLFQSPVTINAQNKDANLTNERRISADIHAESMK